MYLLKLTKYPLTTLPPGIITALNIYISEFSSQHKGASINYVRSEGRRAGEVKSVLPRTGGGGGGEAQSVRTPSNFLLKSCFHNYAK